MLNLKKINSLLKNEVFIIIIILFVVFLIYLLMKFFNIKEGLTENTIPSFYSSQLNDNTNPQDIDSTNYMTYNNTVVSGFGPLIIRNYDNSIHNFIIYYYYTGSPGVSVTYYDRTQTQTQVLVQNKVVDTNTVSINAISLVNGILTNDHTTIPLAHGDASSRTTNSSTSDNGSSTSDNGSSTSSSSTTPPSDKGDNTSITGSSGNLIPYNVTNISSGNAIASVSG